MIKKAELKLLNWNLSNVYYDEDCILAWGILKGKHQRIDDGTYIHTSQVKKIEVKKDKFIVTTHSESLYELEFSEIDLERIEKTKAGLRTLLKYKYDEKFLDKIIKEKKIIDEVFKNSLNEILDNDCLYLEIGEGHMSRGFLKQNNELFACDSHVHSGMFTDSVLVGVKGKVDFRYFPKGYAIEIYHWSDGLKSVRIKNLAESTLTVYGHIKKVIDGNSEGLLFAKDFDVEGLISPDGVNGKSLISKSNDNN